MTVGRHISTALRACDSLGQPSVEHAWGIVTGDTRFPAVRDANRGHATLYAELTAEYGAARRFVVMRAEQPPNLDDRYASFSVAETPAPDEAFWLEFKRAGLHGVDIPDGVVRGAATAAVRGLVEAARGLPDAATFRFATEHGDAQRVYGRLGFRVIAVSAQFHRERP